MGYLIGCYAPRNNGKTTTIKALCTELEENLNSCTEVLYSDIENTDESGDIIRAYRRFGTLIYVISGGDNVDIVENAYKNLKFACGGIDCDILVCALTQNEARQTERINKIESVIEKIAENNGHWLNWLDLSHLYDSDSYELQKVKKLKEAFLRASEQIISKRNKILD